MNRISKLFHVLHLQIKNSWSKILFRKCLDYLDNLVAGVIGRYQTKRYFFWRSSIRKLASQVNQFSTLLAKNIVPIFQYLPLECFIVTNIRLGIFQIQGNVPVSHYELMSLRNLFIYEKTYYRWQRNSLKPSIIQATAAMKLVPVRNISQDSKRFAERLSIS